MNMPDAFNDDKYEYIGDSITGYGMWKKLEPHGGYSFWTDEVPPALFIYDEALSDPIKIFEVLDYLGVAKKYWEKIGVELGYLPPEFDDDISL